MAYIRPQTPTQVRGKITDAPQRGGIALTPRRPNFKPTLRNTVKVYAKDQNFAKAMNYLLPRFGYVPFDDSGAADWPRDQFTQRRLRDGDITLEPPPEKNAKTEPRRVSHRRAEGSS